MLAGPVMRQRPVVHPTRAAASRVPCRWRTVPVLAGTTLHRPV